MSGDVLRRYAGGSARESIIIPLHFVSGEYTLGMRIEIGAIAIEREHDEEFRVQARRWNLRGRQLIYSCI
jgi:hypothetical protein